MRPFIILLLCATIFSCKAQTSNTSNQISDTTYLDIKGNSYRYIARIPDSLRTDEQKRLIKTLNDVTVNYMSVKDNHLVFELSKEAFLAKGIPLRYYRILQQNIADNNAYFDSKGIKNVEELVRQRKEV